MLSDRDLGWIAGFLEGEGSFIRVGRDPLRGSMRVSATQVQREPLERLVRLLGGKIMAKHVTHPGWSQCWWWAISGYWAAGLMMTVYPLMSPRRQEQIRRALDSWRKTPPPSRLKTHCPQGHPYTEENTWRAHYGRYPARWCRACKRQTASRVKRRAHKMLRWRRALAAWA